MGWQEEQLKAEYDERMQRIKSNSWSIAGMGMVVLVLLTFICFGLYEWYLRSPRNAALTLAGFAGLALAYLAIRFGVVWWYSRKLKIQYAMRVMTQ